MGISTASDCLQTLSQMATAELQELANRGDPGARMELIVREESVNEITPGLATLKLVRPSEKYAPREDAFGDLVPRKRPCPTIRRTMAEVQPELRALLMALAAGKAPWPLFLHGPSGAGKTAAALALLDCVRSAVRKTPDDMCRDEKAGRNREYVFSRESDLLILDELGTRPASDFEYSMVKQAIDRREEECNRVAIYISNSDPRGLQAAYDDRVASRILCGSVFHLKDRDRRFAR